MGRGRLCHAELRPLAYSMLAELVHHIRVDLSYPQLSRVVYLFCRCCLLTCAAASEHLIEPRVAAVALCTFQQTSQRPPRAISALMLLGTGGRCGDRVIFRLIPFKTRLLLRYYRMYQVLP